MKKVMALLLVICFCAGLCACSSKESITNQEDSAVWKVEYKTDDFGEPIGIPYLTTEISATYDTKNAENKQARITLNYILYEANGFIESCFSMSAKVGSNDAKKDIPCPATVKLKINDQVYEDWLKIPGGYDVHFYAKDSETEYIYNSIYDALISGTDVQMVFDDHDHTKYKFTIESGNFKDVITPILSQYQVSDDDSLSDIDVNNTVEPTEKEEVPETTIDNVLVSEYHWNKPVAISEEYTIGMYNDGTNYWIEISAKTKDTNAIITMLSHGTADLGFDTDRVLNWIDHVASNATDAWKTDGVSYAEMSGYGREWVVYLNLSEGGSGLLGVRINDKDEFEALVGTEILD